MVRIYHLILFMPVFLTLLVTSDIAISSFDFMQIVFPLVFMGLKGTPSGGKEKLAVHSLGED